MKNLTRTAWSCAVLMSSIGAFAANTDTLTFPNNTGKAANDLHIVWSKAVSVTSNDSFKKQSGDGSNKSDFSKGSVPNNGSCDVTISWDGTDPEVKSWYWTQDGKKIRDEKVSSVIAVDTTQQNGMVLVSMKSSEGRILTMFPSELVEGKTIRGTVMVQPNTDSNSTLNGTVLEVGNTKLPNSGAFIATLGSGLTALKLMLPGDGGSVNVPLPATPPSAISPGNLGGLPFGKSVPSEGLVVIGRPLTIPGNFNPNEPITATINGNEANVLTASDWNTTLAPSNSAIGKCDVSIKNRDAVTNFTAYSIGLDLTAERTTLNTGDNATITLKVGPFSDVPSTLLPTTVSLENHTPNTLNLRDGNNCMFTIHPGDINADGFFVKVLSGTALAPGAFALTGNLASNLCGAKTHVFGIDKLNKGKDDKGFYVEWREDCHEGTCHLKAGHAGDHEYSWKKCQTHASKDHKDYYTSADDRDAAYKKLDKEKKEREASNGF